MNHEYIVCVQNKARTRLTEQCTQGLFNCLIGVTIKRLPSKKAPFKKALYKKESS